MTNTCILMLSCHVFMSCFRVMLSCHAFTSCFHVCLFWSYIFLGHPNVRAFIGHGGTNGVYECLYHSVPVVGMPLFGDHYDSMARVHAKEIGILIRWKTLTEKKLMDAINQIINNPK